MANIYSQDQTIRTRNVSGRHPEWTLALLEEFVQAARKMEFDPEEPVEIKFMPSTLDDGNDQIRISVHTNVLVSR